MASTFQEVRKATLADIEQRNTTIATKEYELSKLKGELLDIKYYLNTLIPIGTLPIELLEKIFELLLCGHIRKQDDFPFSCIDCEESEELFRARGIGLDTLAVSRVCHLWRTITLGMPKFWTNVPARIGTACLEEFVHRAASLPISVQVTLPLKDKDGSKSALVMHNIFRNLQNIQDLSVVNWTRETERAMVSEEYVYRKQRYWDWPIPLLRTFSLAAPEQEQWKSNFPIILPKHCSSLVSLSLSEIPLNRLNTSRLPSLRELNLNLPYDNADTTGILTVLEGFKQLTSLCLQMKGSRECYRSRRHLSRKMVSLPSLRSIRLQDFGIWLLHNLILSPNVNLSVKANWGVAHPSCQLEDYAEILAILPSHFKRVHLLPLPCVLDEQEAPVPIQSIRFTTNWAAIEIVACTSRDSVSKTHARWYVDGPSPCSFNRADRILQACKVFPVGDIRRLELYLRDDKENFTPTQWKELFHLLPQLEVLSISATGSIPTLAPALKAVGSTESFRAWPLLKTVRIRPSSYIWPDNDAAQCKFILDITDAWIDALSLRSGEGMVLQEMTIDMQEGLSTLAENLGEDDFSALKDLVGRVVLVWPRWRCEDCRKW